MVHDSVWIVCYKSTANLQAQHERELKQLKTELLEMKKQRVKMLNKMRSEASKLMDIKYETLASSLLKSSLAGWRSEN